MKRRSLAAAALLAAMLVVPQIAEAAWGYVTGASALNLRTCASVSCARITSMPYGARVWIMGSTGGWYQLNYNGAVGYASGRYVSTGVAAPPPYFGPAPFVGRPPPPTWGYYQNPWWDHRYGAWYDGHRWYFNGRWYDRPSGFYFGFRIGP